MESWHSLKTQEVFRKLAASKHGLSEKDARKRLKKFGPNKLPEAKRFTQLEVFLRQLKSPLVYLLVIAAGISFFLNEELDGLIILAAVSLTTFFGFFQEQKTESTLLRLKTFLQPIVHAMRNGKEMELNAADLVPGDIVFIGEGEKVPADIRLTAGKNLEIQEAALTGESMPIVKTYGELELGTPLAERTNMAFMGTVISRGKAQGIVVDTGIRTEFGKIAESLLKIEEEETPFQKKIGDMGRWITFILIGIVVLLFIAGLLRGIVFQEIFTASVAVAVAAIPESLVVATTMILAIGMMRLLKKKALVRRLVSAETLGSATVICVDKTGTLTEGKMEVSEVYTESDSLSRELALEIAMIANEAYIEHEHEDASMWKVRGDPTDTALIHAGIESGLAELFMKLHKNVLDELPFESQNQYMAALLPNVVYYKGAPEKILRASVHLYDPEGGNKKKPLAISALQRLEKIYEDFSRKGQRVLAVAYRELEGDTSIVKFSQIENIFSDLVFVGFIALHDPIRTGVRATIVQARQAGIKVVMITGDHKYTAETVARELGFRIDHQKIVEGKDLARMDDKALKKEVEHISVYARILPHDKLRIIEAFQANGEVVAMTGDGVNDAPALKRADIGVAMGSGSDVAKESSDIIVLDNNFRTIVGAIEQGRVIFDNLRKVVTFLLSDSFTEIILIGASVIAGFPLPVLAGQILWVNLVEDALPAFALAYEPKEKDVMNLPPAGRSVPILDRQMKVIIFIVGIVGDLLLLGLFLWILQSGFPMDYIRTMVFTVLGSNSLLYIFSIKSLRHSILRIDLFDNKYLVGAVLFGWGMMVAAVYMPFLQKLLRTVPLHAEDWLIVAALGIAEIILIETAKKLFVARKKI